MKQLNPYLTGGITPDWTDYLLAYQEAGADAVEIGLPFSDPMMDGATIQQASDQALRRGVTIDSILADLVAVRAHVRIPLIAMTYANLVFRDGPETFCRRLAGAGISGLIVPDVPVDEAGRLEAAATAAGIDLILLAAPVTAPDRLAEIGRRSRGFVYAVSVMDTTGERDALAATAAPLARRLREVTELPVLIGFGISTPGQAAAAARAGDGVVIASALMRRVLEGASPDDLRAEVAGFRAALDQVDQEMPVARAHPEVSGYRR
ncbi:tryptophan synthase alpha chain [Actinoplanes cyaneus]|uniref:Tryptophan synthase alpha chain n=1 Tax=Actinoplanes cyaneus TaxID=52696 RepID=A0A919IG09_9ACTN|nr:tryptophan synthase subunit alpha [Actinoplanes cyaneus]MCW2137784.1 tryptophan synthase, alpha chain [Actinoplanes cyaneus]GID65009.1 tryptophan synthase alpha chain [Actinoplanes cyaneus]